MLEQNLNNFLKGKLDQKDVHVPKSKIAFFISSTFTDTHEERNQAIDYIVPELNKEYRQYGISIIISDMRTGVKDSNTAL